MNRITLTNGLVYQTRYRIRFTSEMENNPGLWAVIVTECSGTKAIKADEVKSIDFIEQLSLVQSMEAYLNDLVS